MTRNISTNLQNHFNQELTTLATLWKLVKPDNSIMGFTNHDVDIVYNSITYYASSAFNSSDVNLKSDYSVSSQEIDGILSSSFISEDDLFAGSYDYSQITIMFVNYNSLADGVVVLFKGWLGQVKFENEKFSAEIRSLSEKINKNIGEIYTPSCRANLGDYRCKFNLLGNIVSGDPAKYTTVSVTSVVDNLVFYSSSLSSKSDNLFTSGEILWTSGLNTGLSMEIKDFVDGEVYLVLPMPNSIYPNDEFTITVGCDKDFNTCKSKFNNIANFRGEPYVPGQSEILKTSTTK